MEAFGSAHYWAVGRVRSVNYADIRFEGKPMWQSFLPEADAALAAADIDPLIALLRQIEAHAAVPGALRDQAAAVLREYAAGRRASVRKAKTSSPQTNARGANLG
jgi:hypothetical protein